MENIYWIGIRESDLLAIDHIYNGSITFFGSAENNNICLFKSSTIRKNHNSDLPILGEFYRKEMQRILNKDPEAKFMFYNPIIAYSLEENLRQHVICLNAQHILKILDDKMLCKLWLKKSVKLLESVHMFKQEISLAQLNSIFNNKQEYIIQAPVSSGGTGTYILNFQNQNKIIEYLDSYKIYTISPYYKNAISLNVHCVIYENTFKIYPCSIQIVKVENDSLLYKGCDFITAQSLTHEVKRQINLQATNICIKLNNNNYRGVCGIDFMLIDNNVFFCEINPRFQASSAPLNLALKKKGMLSINEATINAFKNSYKPFDDSLDNISVSYSSYAYEVNSESKEFINNMFQVYFKAHPENNILKDGYYIGISAEPYAYLYRIILSQPLTNIINNKIRLNELFCGYELNNPIDLIYLKIMLINLGVDISSEALSYIKEKGDIRKANFSAIDIILRKDLIINCPYRTNFTKYTPFTIRLDKQELLLYYFNNFITTIGIYYESKLNVKKTSLGVAYNSVAFLATDRLRINYNSVCYYKKIKKGCYFCNLPSQNQKYNSRDVNEIVADFIENEQFRHILLGGGSSHPRSDFFDIIELASYLKKITDKPLYLMSLPPQDLNIISQLYQSGISEIAFNIEIFDSNLAKQFMPGKGEIPREHYFAALQKAVEFWGKGGNVRSMIIIGLESEESLLSGIERLCQIGVQPMLSVFRPLEQTPLETLVPLPSKDIYNLYIKIEKICAKYNQSLGPSCIYCQNNTLAIPAEYRNNNILIN